MAGESEDRFAAYVEALSATLGHADRSGPFKDYCLGLLMPVERKSVEPLAAITAPGRTAAQHQSLLHVVGQGSWSDERVMNAIRDQVLPSIERHGAIGNYPVRRETGKEQMVKVRHDGGVANRIGPEPCVSVREGRGEASAGERTGQPLSRESYISRAPTALSSRKAKRTGVSSRMPAWPGVVADPGMCGRSLSGNREISRSADSPRGQSVRGGKARSRSRR